MPNNREMIGRTRPLLMTVLLGALGTVAPLLLPQLAQAQQPYIGEVICGGWNFCPNGWAECNGQLLSIAENDALFTLIGTTYGGDGQTNFAVPNIQGRTMVGQGTGPGLTTKVQGEMSGTETVTLMTTQIPSHTHPMAANAGAEKSASPAGKIVGTAPGSAPVFSSSAPTTTLSASAVGVAGQSQPHNNLQPYLAVKCCISLFGVFPTQN
ncbi:MAG: tail fiber protein [Rhodoferax sp.]